MQLPLDDAVLAQALQSQLRASCDLFPRPSAGLVDITQDSDWEQTPDDGAAFPPVRTRPWPREACRRRPASPTARPRISWTRGPGIHPLMRPTQIYRRQIPGRPRGLSRSISTGRRLDVECRYRDLLQEAPLLGSADVVAQEQPPGFQESIAPSLFAHEFRPREGWDIRNTRPVPGMGTLELEDPVTMPCPETAEDDTSENSNDSPLDGIDQPDKDCFHLDPDHRLWGVKESVFQHAQTRFAKSYQSIQRETVENWTPLFACPFFRKDPARYWPCLADTSMTTIRGVKQHLWRHHSQPYYCPVCYAVFPVASERDIHIMKRSCEKRDVVRFDGMTPEQKTLVLAGSKGYSKPAQWRRIWDLLFERPPAALEPFLSTGLSWKITLVTGFWKAKGKDITEQFLSDMGTAREGLSRKGCDDTALSGVVNAVLRDLVGLVFWQSALGRERGTIPALELAI